MSQILKRWLHKLQLLLYRHKVKDALALHRRGEARSDGLTLDNVSSRLEIRWRARDIHPWDHALSGYEREIVFADQALADTEAAIWRLFDKLPHVDVMEVSVLEPGSERLIAEGTVYRSALSAASPRLRSTGMRLRELGVRYRFASADRDDSEAMAPSGEFCTR
jgi:hypothetical protein